MRGKATATNIQDPHERLMKSQAEFFGDSVNHERVLVTLRMLVDVLGQIARPGVPSVALGNLRGRNLLRVGHGKTSIVCE